MPRDGEEKITLNTSQLSFDNYVCCNFLYKQFEEISRIGIPLMFLLSNLFAEKLFENIDCIIKLHLSYLKFYLKLY